MDSLFASLRRQAYSSDADNTLLARFTAGGDEGAFAELVRRHGPVVYAVARRRLPDTADAADVFQATFLLLVRKASRLADRPSVGPWLYRTAALTARNLRRRNARRPAHLGGEAMPLRDPDPAVRWDLDDALLALSERDRAAVVLCHLQGHTRREAADRLGLPEGTLSTVLHRALRRLRVRLGRDPLPLLAVSGITMPVGLAGVTTRAAVAVWAASPSAAGVALTVTASNGLWRAGLGKLAAMVTVTVGAGLGTGFALRLMDRGPDASHSAAMQVPMPELRASIRVTDHDGQIEWTGPSGRQTFNDPDELRPRLAHLRIDGQPWRVELAAAPTTPPDRLLAVVRACVAGGFPAVHYTGPAPGLTAAFGTETRDWGREPLATTPTLIHLPTAFELDSLERPAELLVGRLRGSVTRDHTRAGRPVIGVSLAGVPLTASAVETLVSLTDLTALTLRGTGLTDRGLSPLARLPALTRLDLSDNPEVSDAGLEPLMSMRHLVTLDLRNTQVTAAGMDRLQKALPGCRIQHGTTSAAADMDGFRNTTAGK